MSNITTELCIHLIKIRFSLMLIPTLLTSLIVCIAAFDVSHYRNHVDSTDFKPNVKTEIPKIKTDDLPKNFWWGNKDGKNYLTMQRNQHIPIYCGACWAFSAASALSDRIKIMRNAAWPDVILSPQVLISC